VTRFLQLLAVISLLIASLTAPIVAQPPVSAETPRTGELSAKKQLTLDQMFAEQGGMASAPMGMQWSPDGTKISYLQRGRDGEQQSLSYFDPATGKSAVLIAGEKLAALAPAASATKDDRQRDNRARFGVAAYHWSPDSKSVLFDANGRLWLVDVATGAGKADHQRRRWRGRSEVLARRRRHGELRAQARPVRAGSHSAARPSR
jgi:hypothetical protein